jgi:signal recognition particle subunit SEC65
MADRLTIEDLELILEALGYQQQAFTDYRYYPSEEFKRSQIARVESVSAKIRAIRKARSD